MRYEFEELGYAVIIHKGKKEVFLQGDDAHDARRNLESLKKVWKKRGPHGPFKTFEEHFAAVFDAYF